MSRPTIIAHRGSHHDAPENSMAAVHAALKAGAGAIELDVHATADGVVVVHHDSSFTDGGTLTVPNAIALVDYAQLASASLADGSAIPLLSEVLSAAAGKAHVHVEIKARNIEREVLSCIAESQCDASVHSFDHRVIRRCAALNQRVRRGILLESYLVDTARAMHDAAAQDVWQQFELIDAELVRTVHAEGARLVAWTVNDTSLARDLAQLGVDALCTDDVAATVAALAQP